MVRYFYFGLSDVVQVGALELFIGMSLLVFGNCLFLLLLMLKVSHQVSQVPFVFMFVVRGSSLTYLSAESLDLLLLKLARLSE